MPKSVDENTTYPGTLIEQLGLHRPWLAKELQEHKLLYLYASVLYASEDALNLVFSYLSLGFALNDSRNGHSDSLSASEFHHFESTPDGLAVTIACALFLVSYSSIATYYADSDNSNNLLIFYIVLTWSYTRDKLKSMKWAYKGIRSTLSVILLLSDHKELLFHLLFPIAIAFSIAALLNRVWIRWMKADRKEMMRLNFALCDEIAGKNNALNVLLTLPSVEEAIPYIGSFIYVKNDDITAVYYVEATQDDKGKTIGKLIPIPLDLNEFESQLYVLQSDNLCSRMRLTLGLDAPPLHFLQELPNETLRSDALDSQEPIMLDPERYANSYIYLTDTELEATAKLYFVDQQGIATRDAKRSRRFDEILQAERKKKHLIGIKPHQIHSLIPKEDHQRYPIQYTYKQWLEYKQSIQIHQQSKWLVVRCYLATAYSALIDGLYFYMGVLLVVSFSPHLFIAMLAISSVLFAICFAARMYQEYDFRRKLIVTEIKVALALSVAEFDRLSMALDDVTPTNALALQYEQLIEYQRLQQLLHDQVVFSFGSAVLEGLTNGLSLQGVIASLMFFIIAILFIAGTPCPPLFVLIVTSIGMAALIACLVQYVVSYQVYINTVQQQAKNDPLPDWETEYASCDGDIALQKGVLLRARSSLDGQPLDAPPQFYIVDWCEVFRLLFSGCVKAEKTYAEVTIDCPSDYQETWGMLVVSIIFTGIVGIAFALRTIKKQFTPSDTSKPTAEVILQEVSEPVNVFSREQFSLFKPPSPSPQPTDIPPWSVQPSAQPSV